MSLFDTSLTEVSLPLFLLGDGNINTLTSYSVSNEYLSSVASFGLLPVTEGVTRIESSTCLDHIFVPAGLPTVHVQYRIILSNVLGDHYSVRAIVRLT